MTGTFKIGYRTDVRRMGACVILAFNFLCYGPSSVPSAQALESHLVDRPRRPLFAALTLNTMPTGTREVAEILEVLPLLNELYDNDHRPAMERKIILRQKIQETILESYLDAASVLAECDREQVHLETLDDLSDEITMIADVASVSDLLVHHLRDLLRMIDSDIVQ
jgi:hypothetical protein